MAGARGYASFLLAGYAFHEKSYALGAKLLSQTWRERFTPAATCMAIVLAHSPNSSRQRRFAVLSLLKQAETLGHLSAATIRAHLCLRGRFGLLHVMTGVLLWPRAHLRLLRHMKLEMLSWRLLSLPGNISGRLFSTAGQSVTPTYPGDGEAFEFLKEDRWKVALARAVPIILSVMAFSNLFSTRAGDHVLHT
jgi:hypothetical protein